jgi:hypothetical protein
MEYTETYNKYYFDQFVIAWSKPLGSRGTSKPENPRVHISPRKLFITEALAGGIPVVPAFKQRVKDAIMGVRSGSGGSGMGKLTTGFGKMFGNHRRSFLRQ